MTETEFLQLSELTLRGIEMSVEGALNRIDVDVECTLAGNVLEIEFMDKGTKIIINSQMPMREIWVAAPSGGYHFRRENDRWIDSRSGFELRSALSDMISAQTGSKVALDA